LLVCNLYCMKVERVDRGGVVDGGGRRRRARTGLKNIV
jgi:hypothetical protein